jgi:hypothetical protein
MRVNDYCQQLCLGLQIRDRILQLAASQSHVASLARIYGFVANLAAV